MKKTTKQTALWVGIIASFLIFLFDVRYMVNFHYLPYAAGNLDIRGEMLEILSLFPRSEKIRLFFDISLILSFISGLFIKKNRSLAAILIIEIFLRIFCLLYDSYVNIVPIIGKKSVAADIVMWEWQKYLLGIILFISIITFSFLKSNVFVKPKEKHESDNFWTLLNNVLSKIVLQ